MASKTSRLVLVVLLIAAVAGYFAWQRFGSTLQEYRSVANSKQALTDIRAVVKKDVRFLDVTVNARPDATIVIVAPAKLSTEAKAALGQILKKYAAGQKVDVSYVVQVEGSDR